MTNEPPSSPFELPSRVLRRLDPWLDRVAGAERLTRAILAGRWQLPRRRNKTPRPHGVPGGATGAPVVLLAALPWDYRFQRPQQLAVAIGQLGHPVLYVEGFLKTWFQARWHLAAVAGGVWCLRLRIPGRPDLYRRPLSSEVAEMLAERVHAVVRGRPLAIVAQLPTWGAVGLELRRLSGAPVVYDRIDLHRGFHGVGRAIEAAEATLLEKADAITASSNQLLPPSLAGQARLLLRNAATEDNFRGPRAERGQIVVGYVGALSSWFDVEAVATLARARPSWRLRLAGRLEEPRLRSLRRLSNVELVGEIAYQEVPGFLQELAVMLIPFRDTPLTRAVDAVKLYEALAAGVPVVARALPEMVRWFPPAVYTYESPNDLTRTVERALAEDSPAATAARRGLAANESWARRATQLLEMCCSLGG